MKNTDEYIAFPVPLAEAILKSDMDGPTLQVVMAITYILLDGEKDKESIDNETIEKMTGLSAEEVRDAIVKIPRSILSVHHLVERDEGENLQ